tara:strand:- start:356 stop:568 length:213 start_codon:yes stop_codon:yes gene_type:complete
VGLGEGQETAQRASLDALCFFLEKIDFFCRFDQVSFVYWRLGLPHFARNWSKIVQLVRPCSQQRTRIACF